MKLVVVTATTNLDKAQECITSWRCPTQPFDLVIVLNAPGWNQTVIQMPPAIQHWGEHSPALCLAADYVGTVPAFNLGVKRALLMEPDIIACFHDDLELSDPDWAKKVITHFTRHPNCGLAGFGGAIGLGDSDIYQKPYDPMQLARVGFRSNMTNAEAHGIRSLLPERVACLDGFSQIGRREFFEGKWREAQALGEGDAPPWQKLQDLGVTHHFYDSMLGCYAKRYGWETWYLPISCHHYGGRTAVGDRGYQAWASHQVTGGDHGFWEAAHRIGYDEFRDVLPIRV